MLCMKASHRVLPCGTLPNTFHFARGNEISCPSDFYLAFLLRILFVLPVTAHKQQGACMRAAAGLVASEVVAQALHVFACGIVAASSYCIT